MENQNNTNQQINTNELPKMEVVPEDNSNKNSNKQAINAWKSIFRLMDDVKNYMELIYMRYNGDLERAHVDYIMEYINNSLNTIIKNTMEEQTR